MKLLLLIFGVGLGLFGALQMTAAFKNPNLSAEIIGHATFFFLLSGVCFWSFSRLRKRKA